MSSNTPTHLIAILERNQQSSWQLVVRLEHNYFCNGKRVEWQVKLHPLKSKSLPQSYNYFIDIMSECEGVPVVNLYECSPGYYNVITVNEHRDWESGIIEDWEYKLTPYKEATNDR